MDSYSQCGWLVYLGRIYNHRGYLYGLESPRRLCAQQVSFPARPVGHSFRDYVGLEWGRTTSSSLLSPYHDHSSARSRSRIVRRRTQQSRQKVMALLARPDPGKRRPLQHDSRTERTCEDKSMGIVHFTLEGFHSYLPQHTSHGYDCIWEPARS